MDKTLKCIVTKMDGTENRIVSDELLVREYPLSIFLNEKKIATLLCSPENLKELAFGFLRTEELIENIKDIVNFNLDEEKGIIHIKTKKEDITIQKFQSKKLNMQSDDNFGAYEFINSIACTSVDSDIVLEANKIYKFMEKNLNNSDVFKQTGGVHSIAIADTKEVIIICEDVARHNAMDKAIGKALLNNVYLKDKVIVLSGRVSLEMILKSAKMQIPIIISKSAPTNLSVALANKLNITLVGFVRNNKMNIYSGDQRIK